MTAMYLEVSQLQVHYPNRPTPAVAGVSFGLRAGDIGVLIGPSGCGKTTLLRAVAGLERASSGEIKLAKSLVSSVDTFVPAESRRIGMVFQDTPSFRTWTWRTTWLLASTTCPKLNAWRV